MFMPIHILEKFNFVLETDVGSLSLLSNRVDTLVPDLTNSCEHIDKCNKR